MLSAKQSVIVQDCSQTRNNNELKKRQRSGRKQQKIDQKVKMLTQDFARGTFPGRAKKFYVARHSFSSRARKFQARAKFDTRGLISRETKMISRETKRCRAKVQTSFADSEKFQSD